MATQPRTFYTAEQYLELEEKAEYKSEYFRGEIFATSGGSGPHSQLAMNAGSSFIQALRKRGCKIYGSDMRVHIPATTLYTYPDVSIVCGPPNLMHRRTDTLLNPVLIVEVLSPSTEAYDRGEKFASYRGVESLQYYLLISSERIAVELFTRQSAGSWLLTSAEQMEGTIEIEALGVTLSLKDLYDGVEVPVRPAREVAAGAEPA